MLRGQSPATDPCRFVFLFNSMYLNLYLAGSAKDFARRRDLLGGYALLPDIIQMRVSAQYASPSLRGRRRVRSYPEWGTGAQYCGTVLTLIADVDSATRT